MRAALACYASPHTQDAFLGVTRKLAPAGAPLLFGILPPRWGLFRKMYLLQQLRF